MQGCAPKLPRRHPPSTCHPKPSISKPLLLNLAKVLDPSLASSGG